jgi:hypothetical protein
MRLMCVGLFASAALPQITPPFILFCPNLSLNIQIIMELTNMRDILDRIHADNLCGM